MGAYNDRVAMSWRVAIATMQSRLQWLRHAVLEHIRTQGVDALAFKRRRCQLRCPVAACAGRQPASAGCECWIPAASQALLLCSALRAYCQHRVTHGLRRNGVPTNTTGSCPPTARLVRIEPPCVKRGTVWHCAVLTWAQEPPQPASSGAHAQAAQLARRAGRHRGTLLAEIEFVTAHPRGTRLPSAGHKAAKHGYRRDIAAGAGHQGPHTSSHENACITPVACAASRAHACGRAAVKRLERAKERVASRGFATSTFGGNL